MFITPTHESNLFNLSFDYVQYKTSKGQCRYRPSIVSEPRSGSVITMVLYLNSYYKDNDPLPQL